MVFRNFGTEHSDVRTCIDGVNEQVAAATRNQCTDARNVWERGGRLVQRPGAALAESGGRIFGSMRFPVAWQQYINGSPPPLDGIRGIMRDDFYSHAKKVYHVGQSIGGVFSWASEAVSPGTFGRVFSVMDPGDSIYIGFDIPVTAFGLTYTADQTNDVGFTASYWDGAAWQPVTMRQYLFKQDWSTVATEPFFYAQQQNDPAHYFLKFSPTYTYAPIYQAYFMAAPTTVPQVARTLDVKGSSYWWKITTTGNATSGPVGAYSFTYTTYEGLVYRVPVYRESFGPTWMASAPVIVSAVFPTSQRIYGAGSLYGGGDTVYFSSESIGDGSRWVQIDKQYQSRAVGSAAVNVQGGVVYIALSGRVTKHLAQPSATDDIEARVETADWAIGSGAPYDQNSIALLKAFPAASLVAWFQNRLWFGAIDGEPNAIRWSAAAPYNEVIPQLAVEYIDQPPTAMKPLGENMVIYTQDNIYVSVLDSIDDFGVPHFKFIKAVAGRGCVAQNSVVEINGRHVFLSEDGLYAFDGTSAIKKITLQQLPNGEIDRLQDTFASVNRSARQAAYGVHWRTERVALFSIPVAGSSTNNRIVVWDYERDKFWLWDGLNAQALLNVNTNTTDEQIYFFTAGGAVYRLDKAIPADDTTPISTYIVTSPIGMRDSMHKGMTETKVLAGNHVGQLSVQSWPNGVASQAKTGTLNFSDYNESKVGTMVIGRDKVAPENIRFRHTHFKTDGSYFQVKVIGPNALGKRFDMVHLAAFYVDKYEDTR